MQMFVTPQKSVEQKPLKMPTFCLSMFMCINVFMYWYVYKLAEADVSKLIWVHIGCVRPKIKDEEVVYCPKQSTIAIFAEDTKIL